MSRKNKSATLDNNMMNTHHKHDQVRNELCLLRLSPNTPLHQGAKSNVSNWLCRSIINPIHHIVQEWECRNQNYHNHIINDRGPFFDIELLAKCLCLMGTNSPKRESFQCKIGRWRPLNIRVFTVIHARSSELVFVENRWQDWTHLFGLAWTWAL